MTKYFLLVLPFLMFACKDKRETTKVTRNQLVEAVYSSVTVEPQNVYQINSAVSGFIDELYVDEGDLVNQGDLLCVISNKTPQLNEENSKLSYMLLQDSYKGNSNILEEMQTELQSVKIKFQSDSTNMKRIKNLLNSGAISKSEYDNVALNYEVSKNNYLNAKKRLARKEKELANQSNQLKNNVIISKLKAEDYLVKSTLQGEVFQFFKKKGEYVSMQEPVAIVGKSNSFILKMKIDEVDISNVQLGQRVIVSLEAFKNRVFDAEITKIYPKMDDRSQTFTIEADFVKSPGKLYMGLTGEANIVIHEKKSALVIPREYLIAGNKVETESGIIHVETGLSNWSYVEILKGLKEGMVILKPE